VINHYLKQHRRELLIATSLCTLSSALSIVLLAQLNRIASAGLVAGEGGSLPVVLALLLAMFLGNLAAQTYLARFGAATIASLRRDLSARFMALDYEKLMASGKHLVGGALIADVSRVATMFLVLPLFAFNALTVVFCLVYLTMLSLPLFAVFAAVMAFAIGSSMRMMGRSGAIFGAMREQEEKLFGHFAALAEGKKELTLSAGRARHFAEEVLAPSIEANRELNYRAQKWWGYGGAWSTTMVFCAVLGVVYAGQAWFGTVGGTILQFVIVALFMMNPLNYLIVASRDVMIGMASLRQLGQSGLAPVPSAAPGSGDPAIRPGHWQRIDARGLRYRYHEDDGHGFGFGPVDLSLRRGETVFLVGGNGSGKSTLGMLLCGLTRPSEGRIEVDGTVVDETRLSAYRSLYSGVFFDFHLFTHMIDRQGHAAGDATVAAWLERLDLDGKVAAKEGELSTLALSQGQRKRLALAQSCIDEADIYLFDEWAADQDPGFRRYFYLELLPELKQRGKTIVAITHDERYFDAADRVLKLEQGRLVQASVGLAATPETA
jgi:cyclic peptide transporter